MDRFGSWWSTFKSKSKEERLAHYNSLNRDEQLSLRESFLQDGWCELFCQNHIDQCLDQIKSKYAIDLLDLRIKALKHRRVFVIPKQTWEEIEQMILEYEPLFNSDIIFGGLVTKPWGTINQCIVVSAQRRNLDA
jgi:hypothetical protein